MKQDNVINDSAFIAAFTMEDINAPVSNNRIYLKGVSFLTGKLITGIRTVGNYIGTNVSFGNGVPLVNSNISQIFALNLVANTKKKEILVSNLPLLSMAYKGAAGSQTHYTPFNGVYDFDNSFLEKFTTGALQEQVIFLEFRYKENNNSNGSYTKN